MLPLPKIHIYYLTNKMLNKKHITLRFLHFTLTILKNLFLICNLYIKKKKLFA